MAVLSAEYDRALQLHLAGREDEAAEACDRVVAADPSCVEGWNLRGSIALRARRYDDAALYLKHAVELRPDFADAHNNLGLALQAQGDLAGAVSCFRRAITLKPTLAVALCNLGNALTRAGDIPGAIECCARAIQIQPGYVTAHLNLGIALFEANEWDNAEATFCRALELDPRFAEAHYNLGCVSRARGRFSAAREGFLRAVSINPAMAEAQKNLAQIALLAGHFDEGWQRFEWRWKTGELPVRQFSQPDWSGEPLKRKTILVWAEQGFGDTFQFIRYAPLLKERGGTVIVECQKALVSVLARCSGIDRLIAEGDELPAFDFQAPLLSLPRIFGTRLETIPANVPHVFAEPGLVEAWRERLAGIRAELDQVAAQVPHGEAVRGLLTGINWSGRSDPGPHKQRDIPLEHFERLAAVPGVQLVGLQKGGDSSLTRRVGVVDFGEELDAEHGAFMDTAAIMMNLDLVITSDTSVAHLAGALGVPVWVALPFVPDWRWMLERSDSPWYSTMRLFRQKTRGDWAGVFGEIEEALREGGRMKDEG